MSDPHPSWRNILIKVAGGWSYTEEIYKAGVAGTPLAAASSYTNVSTGTGYDSYPESWIQRLQLSNTGIEANTWTGDTYSWVEQYYHPPAMTNSTVNARSYSAIAVTSIGSAFAVVTLDGNSSIEGWQVEDSLLDWSSTGTVVILSD